MRRRGFTLIEVVVTLAIMGLIMTTVYAVLFGTLRARRNLEVRVMGSRVGPMLLDRIEEDVRRIFLYDLPKDSVLVGVDGKDYGRDADRILFVARTPSTAPVVDGDRAVYADVNEVGYAVTRNPDNPDFMVLWRREDYFVDDEPLAGGRGIPLYDRVTQFDVRYYEELGEDAEPLDDWNSEEKGGLPKAVEIVLSLEVEPRPAGSRLTPEELERRTYTFKRWITFPEDDRFLLAVRPVVPIPPEEYETGDGPIANARGDGSSSNGGSSSGGAGGAGGAGAGGGGGAVGTQTGAGVGSGGAGPPGGGPGGK